MAKELFPTNVGVILLRLLSVSAAPTFPHTRGGDPEPLPIPCTIALLFPTHVGVILEISNVIDDIYPYPHTRRGDPEPMVYGSYIFALSPHTWG